MKTKTTTLLGAVLSLLVTCGITQVAAAEGDRLVFNTPVIVGGTPKHPTYAASQIYSVNADGSGATQLASGNGWAMTARWSPDRQYIAFYREGMLHVMESIGEVNGGRVFDVAPALSTGSAWSPDGTKICLPGSSVLGYGLWIASVNPATGEVGTPSRFREGVVSWPAWSPASTLQPGPPPALRWPSTAVSPARIRSTKWISAPAPSLWSSRDARVRIGRRRKP